MQAALLRAWNLVFATLYVPLKLLRRNRSKIVFMSRQESRPSVDFVLLRDELLHQRPNLHLVFICNRLGPGLASRLSFIKDLLRSLYHLATSSVCILDSYWPAVSVLNHGRGLTVIQMWHALGKIKQSGLQTVGRPGGRSEDAARIMRMHRNYDYIVAGAPVWNDVYCACFGCTEDRLLNVGLPRLDLLVSSRDIVVRSIKACYPQLAERVVVLYAPTFRRGAHAEHAQLIEAIRKEDCELIVKSHPNQEIDAHGALECPEFNGMELLAVADLVITDYSAIALEAAAVGVPTLYYLYDYDDYRARNGINLDIPAEMPGCVYYDAASLMEGVRAALAGRYPSEQLERYRSKFLISDPGHSTRDLAAFVLACADGGKDAGAQLIREKRCA